MSNDPEQGIFQRWPDRGADLQPGKAQRHEDYFQNDLNAIQKALQKISEQSVWRPGRAISVEGSVRKHGNNLRITAQFLDADRDIHLWAETYRGTMDDIFDIQEKVAIKIVDALRVQLTGDEKNVFKNDIQKIRKLINFTCRAATSGTKEMRKV